MRRIIINIPDESEELRAVECVLSVMKQGRVSQTTDGTRHFCWLTKFGDGIYVSTHRKRNLKTDSFAVYSEHD
jgi:hypothetical protein